MAYLKKSGGTLLVEFGGERVRLRFRRPTVDEMLAALALKYSTDEQDRRAENILRANLELGFACLEGVGSGDLAVDHGCGSELLCGEPGEEGFREDWKLEVREYFPALLVSLGQHLSDVPTRIEELEKK